MFLMTFPGYFGIFKGGNNLVLKTNLNQLIF